MTFRNCPGCLLLPGACLVLFQAYRMSLMKLSGGPVRVLRTLRRCFWAVPMTERRRAKSSASRRERRRPVLMALHRLDKQPVAAAHNPRQHPPRNGNAPLPRHTRHSPRPQQMTWQAPRPVLLVARHKRLQLPQAMRIAKRVLHPRHRPVAFDTPPAAGGASHEATACGRQGEARSRPDASHAPCGPPTPPYARRNTQTLRRPTAHTRQGRWRHARPEQHTRRLRQPPLRQKPTMTKPHRNARKTRTIPNRTRYPLRKRRPRHLTATPAAAGMTAMLRHFRRTRLRKVECLTRYRTTDRRSRPQPRHTAGTCSFTRSGRAVRQSVRPSCPPDRPAAGPSCPSGSASDAPPQASSTHRSMEACRYCRRSDRDGAPTPPAALQHAQPDPEAARSPTRHAQPSPPQSP